ncbi:hypothetical protein ACFQO1_03135 [Jejudonia soesokkakensis]|uniref:YD repeat-containing protein n=1 Tax=Jejudonia soesokkakensis TaxID=1323432 RepID=A0ABW2MSJ3_9FLAO
MKKTLLFLFAICFVLGCSSDGDDTSQGESLNIKKFTTTYLIDNNGANYDAETTYLFDTFGKITSIKKIEFDRDYEELLAYTYNNSGKLLTIERNSNDNFFYEMVYEYSDDNTIETINYINNDGEMLHFLNFEYQNSEVVINEPLINTVLKYNQQNKLIEKESIAEGHTSIIFFSNINNNITNINFSNDQNSYFEDVFTYNEEINPLYPIYKEHFFSLPRSHNNLLVFKDFFSQKNYVSYSRISDSGEVIFSETRTFEYNENNLPVSGEVRVDGVLYRELTYEYY